MRCLNVFTLTAFLAVAACPASAWAQRGFVPEHVRAQTAQSLTQTEVESAQFVTPSVVEVTPRYWADVQYLLWWTKGAKAPPLVTTSPATTPAGTAGVLGQPGTTVLFGGEHLHDDTQPGARFTLGGWLGANQRVGVELNYLFLDEDVDLFHASGNAVPVLARPFFNASPSKNVQDAFRSAYPGAEAGMLQAGATTRFQTFEFTLRKLELQTETFSIDSLIGYRYAELQDHIRIDSTSTLLSGAGMGTTLVQFDDFATRNTFHGGVLGLLINWRPSPIWSTEFVGKAGLGQTRARTNIYGQSVTTAGGVSAQSRGGLYTQGTNLGVFNQDDFSVLSELGLKLRRELAYGWSATMGYTFLYWTDVARAGEKIDPNINATQIPPGTLVGNPQPQFPYNKSGYWAQGLLFGFGCDF
jgi:hypothetical protein